MEWELSQNLYGFLQFLITVNLALLLTFSSPGGSEIIIISRRIELRFLENNILRFLGLLTIVAVNAIFNGYIHPIRINFNKNQLGSNVWGLNPLYVHLLNNRDIQPIADLLFELGSACELFRCFRVCHDMLYGRLVPSVSLWTVDPF